MQTLKTDTLIIGGGIIGLTLARELKGRFPARRIVIIEKEDHIAEHASGRNSGVLHAGFYYTADSLKAKFCRDGNALMRAYVQQNGLKLNDCKKLVVAVNEAEREELHELKKRGDANGVPVSIVGEKEMNAIEPNAASFKEALFSPTSATVDPVEICHAIARDLQQQGVEILLMHPYRERLSDQAVLAGNRRIEAGQIFNCAGLYADSIARDFGFCRDYTIIPFKGVNLIARTKNPPVRALIYPVPNLKNPFLGVHFNVTVHGDVKIGPTAIPAFWRENYGGLAHFNLRELAAIAGWELKLFATDAFHFRRLAFEEMKKYSRAHMLSLVRPMVKHLDESMFKTWAPPGIRAQLLNKKTLELVQDFIVEGDARSVHVLNAVSPAFTSSMAFAKWIAERYAA